MQPLSPALLHEILPLCPDPEGWTDAILAAFDHFSIQTTSLPYFLAQTAQESGQFTEIIENLDYSAEALVDIFPSHFTPELAAQYARNPQAIANHLYANRLGNGDEASGEGWTYRGRGLIQITFKDNYTAFANAMKLDLADAVSLASTQDGAALAAAWFWQANDLDRFVMADDNVGLTKAINGGLMGLQQRNQYLSTAKANFCL